MGRTSSLASLWFPVLLLAVVVQWGCENNESSVACNQDQDCPGTQACVGGTCRGVQLTDATTTDATDVSVDQSPLDVSDVSDVGSDSLCLQALAFIDSCPDLSFVEGTYGLGWPGCDPRDACAAACALRHSCSEMRCDFDLSIDCDAPGPVWDCLQSQCQVPAPECQTDADCGQTYDCCGADWLCYDNDRFPQVCDMACSEPAPPSCGCVDGTCASGPKVPAGSLCERAYDKFTGECGYTIEGVSALMPQDVPMLEKLAADQCDESARCYAACIVHGESDSCMQCHFGEMDCFQDPFYTCVQQCSQGSAPQLCANTGGTWGDSGCENCCGPATCGQQPGELCAAACCGPAQCYCPPFSPFWQEGFGCFADPLCFP